MSLFWDKHINSDIEVFGFKDKPYRRLNLFFHIFRITNKLERVIHKMMQNSRFWRRIKTARELVVLKKNGLLDTYKRFLKQHKAHPCGASIQNFYYFQFIKNRFVGKENLNFLEIGAGGDICDTLLRKFICQKLCDN